jgi:hypothetical protein
VIDERQIEINEREAGFNLRGRFVVKLGELKVTCVVIEISEVVVCFDVSRIVLEREREVVEG